jgi:moderate conductance mechanosensitive channel
VPDFRTSPWNEIVAILRSQAGTVEQILVVIIVTWAALRLAGVFVHGVVKTLADREAREGTAQELSAIEVQKRIGTLDALGTNVLRFIIVVIAAVTVLGTFNLNVGPAIAGLGIVGVALGFGAQSLVKDYLNGSLILVENQFSKGDTVRIAGVSGTVEDFSLRRTTLRDLDGVVHTVPNGEIGVASNLTRVWASINQDVTIAYGTDVDRAISVVNTVGEEMADDPAWKDRILEPPHVLRVEALAEYGITLKVLGSVRAPERWTAAGELRKRLLEAFTKNGIEIPRPQRVVLSRDRTAGPGGADLAVASTADPDLAESEMAGTTEVADRAEVAGMADSPPGSAGSTEPG